VAPERPRAGQRDRPAGPDARPWWVRSAPVPAVGGPPAAARSPEALAERGRAAGRLGTLARAAAAAQAANDEEDALAAVGAALFALGLNGHLALVEPGGTFLVVRAVVLPRAGLAQVERVLGHPVVGTRVDLAPTTPYRMAVDENRAVRLEEPLAWAILAAPGLGRDEALGIGALIRAGEVVLAPLTARGEALGVLTVWASALSEADLATAEILGRIAGGALGAQRARAAGHRDRAALVASLVGA
jgi:hypothetical protein